MPRSSTKLLLLLGLAGCAKHAEYAYPAEAPAADTWGPSGGLVAAPEREPAKKGAYKEDGLVPPPPPPPMDADGVAVGGEEQAPTPPEPATQAASEDRMVHYEGWARLRVADPAKTLDDVIAISDAVGGRTEQLSGNSVSVRVPVATFEDTFQKVLALGDVMDETVRADDVTEAFTAVDLRVKTLRATQQRLLELLGKATDEREKLALLQEITRVTTELDALDSQRRALADLADLSRISVDAVPREAFTDTGGRPTMDGFGWIAGLSPFNRGTYGDDKRLALPTPEGLVALTKTGPFAAESADGVVLWTLRVPNDPVGDAAYWERAVQDRLGEEFANPTEKAVGEWSCLVLDEPGADEPYRWQVCTAVDGRWVEVAQAYFPGPAQVERYAAGVDAALTGSAS